MKISYLTYSLDTRTGWGRYSTDLIEGVRAAGREVAVLVEDGSCGGVPTLDRGARLPASAFRSRRVLKEADIIHALDGYPYGLAATLATVGLGKPVLITGVGTYAVAPLQRGKWVRPMRWAYRRADMVTAISGFTGREIQRKVPGVQVKVLPLGVALDAFRQRARPEFVPRLLSVGALKPRKGYHIAIPAFAQAKETIPDLSYTIVGNQGNVGYFSELRELTRRRGVEGDVRFVCDLSHEQLRSEYQRAGLFLLASVNRGHQFEGYGLVFLEAAAARLPVVGTLGNGIADAVSQGRNGLLVPQNDVAATAEAILAVLGNRSTWQRMSDESVSWAEAHDSQHSVTEYLALYDILCRYRSG